MDDADAIVQRLAEHLIVYLRQEARALEGRGIDGSLATILAAMALRRASTLLKGDYIPCKPAPSEA